jgi:hypothetical protein
MAGAVPMTSLGTGYVVGRRSPRVQIRETLGRFQVIVRDRGGVFAEIVAEAKTRALAEAAAEVA